MTYRKDPRVDGHIDGLPDWQQAICRRVRDLIHAADPEIEDAIKRTVQPYFVLNGNVAALLATKDHGTGRQIAIYRGEPINEQALVDLFRATVANNLAGGWRRLQEQRTG